MARIQQSVLSGFSRITEALGDPAREAIVSALADGKAMPAGELACAAGISPQSASAHLQKLVDAKILSVWSQGRFRYYRIADEDVASLIERLPISPPRRSISIASGRGCRNPCGCRLAAFVISPASLAYRYPTR